MDEDSFVLRYRALFSVAATTFDPSGKSGVEAGHRLLMPIKPLKNHEIRMSHTITPTMEIPVLSYADFAYGTQSQRDNFCRTLYESLSVFGFIKIKNHTIPDYVIDEVFSWSKRFFGMSLENKMKAAHPSQANPHRGWSCIGQEKLSVIAQGKAVFDLKESFDQGPQTDDLYPNIWNEEADLPGFRSFMESFYERCHQLHLSLLGAIALSMSLPPAFFVNACGRNSSELRLNHYPEASCRDILDGKMMRISSHTDFGTITLLFQDSIGGLEIEEQNRPGSYIPIPAANRTDIILNVGDCLQRWTNDHLRSANHRVTVPVELKDAPDSVIQDRYSVAYFGKPNRDVSVLPLRELLGADEEMKYTEDITAWQYNQSRLLQTY